MERKLIEAAQKGDIHKLHSLINDDPLLFSSMSLFGEQSPLHIACYGRHVDFVKEVMSLSPEFVTELNEDGFSPLHIASANGDVEIVKELLKIGPHLCLVKGKDRRIPLHCAVAKGRVKVIRELLSTCLDSIAEVTARGETCFHLALKNNRVEAFMILVDHVILHKKEEILNKNDEQGNSIFHIAAHKKQYEVIHVLLDEKYGLKSTISVNSLNKRGLTPLDVLTSEGGDSEIEEMFSSAGALRIKELTSFPHQANSQTLVTMSSMGRSVEERRSDRTKLPSRRLHEFFKYDKIKDSPTKVRNTLLIVAVLITTMTYQPILSPPGGVWQDNYLPSTNNNNNSNNNNNNNNNSAANGKKHIAGMSVLGTNNPVSYGLFMIFNSLGFFMSLHMLNFLTLGLPLQFELRVAIIALTATYDTCMFAITPGENHISVVFIVMSVVMPVMMPLLTKVVRDFKKKSEGRV